MLTESNIITDATPKLYPSVGKWPLTDSSMASRNVQLTILSRTSRVVYSTVSCREEQPWFSSTVSCLSSSSAPVSLTNRNSITHACISPKYLRYTFQAPKKRKLLSYIDALVDRVLLNRPSKEIVPYFSKKRILVQVGGPCCYKLRFLDAIKEETKVLVNYSKPPFHRHFSRWRKR